MMVIFARCDKVLVIMENNPYQLVMLADYEYLWVK